MELISWSMLFLFFYRTEASDCLSIRTPAGMIADSCSGMPPLQLLFVNELSITMILTAVLLTQHLPEWPVKPPGSNPGSADTEPIPAPHPARYTPAASTHAWNKTTSSNTGLPWTNNEKDGKSLFCFTHHVHLLQTCILYTDHSHNTSGNPKGPLS